MADQSNLVLEGVFAKIPPYHNGRIYDKELFDKHVREMLRKQKVEQRKNKLEKLEKY
jgi:hypothetical protein